MSNGLLLDLKDEDRKMSSELVMIENSVLASPLDGSFRRRKRPEQYADFATILSFLSNYSLLLGCVGELNFIQLASWFQSDQR